ncbi:MAG: hypothetical protein KAW42_04715 [Candidatus Atribacteria bacterium]|nr:hypothetical protein [Candidatus Atribacteria bacterium]
MKKFLVILMVVAMASFLFVGCLPGTTTPTEPTEPTEPTVPTVPTVPATVAPVITSVPDIVGGYVNKAAAADGIVVNGTAPTYSEVKVYINGICAGTGDTGVNGVFVVVVANADLIKAVKVDGAKTLYATAIEPGLTVSASSNVKKFTLDTAAPKIASSKATAGIAGTAKVYKFIETADTTGTPPFPDRTLHKFKEELIVNTTACCPGGTLGEIYGSYCDGCTITKTKIGQKITAPFTLIPATNALLSGVKYWKIEVIDVYKDTDDYVKMRVSNLTDGYYKEYLYSQGTTGTVSTSWVPGLKIAADYMQPVSNIGSYCLLTTTNTSLVAAKAGYIDVTFNEAVTSTSILAAAAKWTAYAATVPLAPAVTVRSSTVARLTETAAGIPNLVTGISYDVSCIAIKDLAGNPSGRLTSTGIVK